MHRNDMVWRKKDYLGIRGGSGGKREHNIKGDSQMQWVKRRGHTKKINVT